VPGRQGRTANGKTGPVADRQPSGTNGEKWTIVPVFLGAHNRIYPVVFSNQVHLRIVGEPNHAID